MNQSIRKKAEALLREQHPSGDLLSDNALPEILHELRVHQIELEMQNDELRRTQEQLQKTQKKYFDLFNFAPVGYLTLDEHGIVQDINLSGAAILERERRFVTERPFIVHLDTTQRIFMDHLNAVFKSHVPQTCELMLKSKERGPVYIRLRSVLRQEAEGPVCWSVMSDITNLRLAENAQRLSEANLHLALDAGQMATWHRDIITGEINFSRQIYAVLGLSPDIPLRRVNDFIKFIHPEDRAILKQTMDEARYGQTFSVQYRVVWPNGEIHWLESMGRSYLDPSGKPVATAGILRDFTKQKELGEALQAERTLLAQRVEERTADLVRVNQSLLISQQRAEALYAFSQVILEAQDTANLLDLAAAAISAILPADRVLIYLLDLDNEAVLHFTKAGPGAATTPQVSYEELADGLTGWVVREVKAALSVGLTPDPRESEAVQQRRKDVVAGPTMVVPMPLHERVLGTVTAVNPPSGPDFIESDLELVQSMANQTAVALKNISLNDSLRSQSEALIIANEELAHASRLKDEFLANMSHELRTPLNAILGMGELLKKQIYGELNAKQAKAVNYIYEGGHHLLELINDILDISKIEAGMLTLSLTEVSISDICEASLRFILNPAMKKGIKIVSNISPSLGTVEVDERRLKQILVNLLYNAVKFTPAGGEVGLDVTHDIDNQTVLFSIWDTGIGISQPDRRRLFKPFVQLDNRLSKEYEGTGLGLALVYHLTEMHGGRIELKSAVGEGSRFTVMLPCGANGVDHQSAHPLNRAVQANSGSSTQAETNGRFQYHILLADDNEANSLFVTDALQSRGYPVTRASNGQEAVTLARKEKPDIILMDIQMPVLDGLGAIQQIRADQDAHVAQIPIIALTALAMSGDKERILRAGANAYLSKPVKLDHLFTLVEKYLLSLDE